MVFNNLKKCSFCNNKKFLIKFKYSHPPKNEINFNIKSKNYKRSLISCTNCNHFFSKHKINLNNFYSGKYNKMNYEGKLYEKLLKIISLPKRKSDNYFRVERIKNFKLKYFDKKAKISLLDIGSGLGVFPYSIKKKTSWDCVSIDPDKSSVNHIKNNLKIKAHHGNFFKIRYFKKFNLITLNKVLEHVSNPIKFLKKTKNNLQKDGIVYLEVPDAEKASKKGKNREEFFIDHLHVFSKLSLYLMSIKAGFEVLKVARVKEPSGKYTLYSFLKILRNNNE